MADLDDINDVVFKLEVENELRVIVGEQAENITLELVNGLAEIFGTEMVLNEVYVFPPCSTIAVFTWHGCTVKLNGRPESACVVTDTPMIIPVNLHACLEELRIKADAEDTKGPVTLIAGPVDVGKSTLSRILLNYAARLGRRPFLIDIDVGQNSISIPGTIGVLPIEKPADIVEGFEQQAHSVLQFGYKSPGHNILLYFLLIKKLGLTLQSRMMSANKNIRSSGVIIDTCGWVRGHGYHAITFAAIAFEINVLFVLEEERLYTQLMRDMPSCVKVVYIPKLGGVVERSRPTRFRTRNARVHEYFYGSTRNPLEPHSFEVPFSDIQILKVTVPFVEDSDDFWDVRLSDVSLETVPIGRNLFNQVLALSFADSVSDDIILSTIIGFICITNVDMEHEILTVLSPQPGPLPKRILIAGDIKLSETSN